MKYLLGIDFGGGASKATLLCENGEIAAENTYEYATHYPQNGWVEQDPDDWYEATKYSIRVMLERSNINPADICAVALDAATHTAVVMDKDYKPVRPAIHWTDTRTKSQVEYLNKNCKELILKQVMHNPGTIWTLPQLMWIRENEPENWARTDKICFAKDYVRHRLTGDFVTDNIEAEGSMLFDYNRQCWSEELCALSGVTQNMLPEIVKPTDVVGKVTAQASEDTGLCEGTPVICGTTDTVMEVFAAGGVSEGKMTVKLATAGRICVITDKAYPDENLINYSHFSDGLWYPGTATKSCAASYRWYRDTFGGDYKELDASAEKLPVGSEGLIFHPYLNGELTPYQNPNLCGSFVGVRAHHTSAHFARAVMEGVCMSMKDCLNALEKIGIAHDDKAVIIGGGGKSPLWRRMLSDSLGITLVQNKHSDSSFGSAMLAGVAVGIWKTAEEALAMCNETVSETEPNRENMKEYDKLYERYIKIQKALEPFYNEA